MLILQKVIPCFKQKSALNPPEVANVLTAHELNLVSMHKEKATLSPETTNHNINTSMKQFAFVNNAAEREYKDFPKEIQQQFGTSLRAVQGDEKPLLPIQTLESIGAGIIELKINSSPAFRCVYIAKFLDTVVVLHSFEKTTNGVDRQAMKTVEKRYKELKAEIEKMKRQK